MSKELADRVVALGVVRLQENGIYAMGEPYQDLTYLGDSQWSLVRDWRVAGALMERFSPDEFLPMLEDAIPENVYTDPISPTAIIQACVEALEAK